MDTSKLRNEAKKIANFIVKSEDRKILLNTVNNILINKGHEPLCEVKDEKES